MGCLEESNGKAEGCTDVARAYLECRMGKCGSRISNVLASC
jgi:hypothetical protein